MQQEITFYLPDFTRLFRFNMLFVKYFKSKPHYFRDGIKIGAIYGVFPVCLWNGGRTILGKCEERYMRQVVRTFENEGIPIRYTFTNPHITAPMLKDRHCNLMLEIAENPPPGIKNGVIVVSEILEKYIRRHYPAYEIISSTCKCITDKNELQTELRKNYDMVVLDYNFNNKFDLLSSLENKEKCELLVNAVCIPECPRRKEHYGLIGEDMIRLVESQKTGEPLQLTENECPCKYRGLYEIKSQRTFITASDIWTIYSPMGFRNFKIEGRLDNIFNLLETYLYYMVNIDYIDIARQELISDLVEMKVINVGI